LVITSPIENTLLDAGIILEQVHHGDGIASWAGRQPPGDLPRPRHPHWA